MAEKKKFAVVVKEVLKCTFIVEESDDVKDIDSAIEAVANAVNEDRILLDCEDFDHREIYESELFVDGVVPEGQDVSYFSQLADVYDE